MLGYWDDDEATAETITADRWLRTGDYGVVEGGRLRLLGRRADLIEQNGESIYPQRSSESSEITLRYVSAWSAACRTPNGGRRCARSSS